MSAEETLTIVRDYLSGRRPENMAEDATFTDFTQPEPLRGREAIAAQFRLFYGGAFQDASAEHRRWPRCARPASTRRTRPRGD